MKERFYYIDKDGNKKKYIGKITKNSDGTYSGLLTHIDHKDNYTDLIYHPEVPEVKQQYAYYSYLNENNENVLYFDIVKTDEEGNHYFTYVSKNMFNLEYVPPVEGVDEYYTYIDEETGEEKKYEGIVNKKGTKYFGTIIK